jgi:hypothetical protein
MTTKTKGLLINKLEYSVGDIYDELLGIGLVIKKELKIPTIPVSDDSYNPETEGERILDYIYSIRWFTPDIYIYSIRWFTPDINKKNNKKENVVTHPYRRQINKVTLMKQQDKKILQQII